MTGKDLVLFIINNNLLDEEFNESKLSESFLTIGNAAIKLGIGTTSLKDMARLALVDYIVINDEMYFPKDINWSSIKRRKYE